ncbi:MAG: extracellular solute-binding protein [Ruminococcus sp.]|jgi:ABC-type glycerol-3-phosphate transport system substrate-binding protein|nr:extracellular solute-binding protein [Ruminococcus sp.]
MKKYVILSVIFIIFMLVGCAEKSAIEPICRANVISSAGEDYQYIADAMMMEDYLLLLCDSSLLTMDFNGNILTKIPLEASTETHIVNYYNLEVTDRGKITFYKTSADVGDYNGKLEKIVIDGEKTTTEDLTADIDNYSFASSDNFDDQPSFTIHGLYNIKPRYYFELPDGNFIVIGENAGGFSSVYKTEIVTEDEKENRTVITVNRNVEAFAAQFNAVNPIYKVEYEEPKTETEFTLDVITGNTADVMFLTPLLDSSYESYAKKGVFEDLLPYFDADPEIDSDDLVESVKNANMIDGHLYSIAPYFTVVALAGRAELLSGLDSDSFTEIKAVADKNEMLIFSYYSMRKRIFIESYLWDAANTFIDKKNGKCYFNTPEFIELLKYTDNYSLESPADPNEMVRLSLDDYRNGRALLKNVQVSDFRDALELETIDFNAPVSFLGYPSATGKSGINAYLVNEAAIFSSSENKEGAWEFIKFMLTKSVISPDRYNSNTSFPLVTSRLQKLADDSLKKYYINELGERVINPTYANDYTTGNEYKMPELTLEHEAQIFDLINSINGIQRIEMPLRTIIIEETNLYNEGKKTAEETALMLQDRVSTYLSEMY